MKRRIPAALVTTLALAIAMGGAAALSGFLGGDSDGGTGAGSPQAQDVANGEAGAGQPGNDPLVTETGVMIPIAGAAGGPIAGQGDTEWQYQVCEADAEVELLDGIVQRVVRKGTKVTIQTGEKVIGDSSPGVLLVMAVVRREDGQLEIGTRNCRLVDANSPVVPPGDPDSVDLGGGR